MARGIAVVLGGVAAGLLLVSLPRLLARLTGALRISRQLRTDSRAAHVEISGYGAYDRRFGAYGATDTLDERTWDDLNLDLIFHEIDRTLSQPGRQYLYHLLRRPQLHDGSLASFEAAVQAFSRNDAVARSIRDALPRLGHRRATDLEAVCFGDLAPRPRVWWMLPALSAGSVLCLVFIAFVPRLLIVWLAICVTNIVVQLVFRPRVSEIVSAMRELPTFLRLADELGRTSGPDTMANTALLADGARRLRTLRWTASWLRVDALSANELVGSLYEWANMLFLLDMSAYVVAMSTLTAERGTMQQMFRAIGFLDVAQSVARWREGLALWCVPTRLTASKALSVTDAVHPLLAEGVPNSLDVVDAGVLITGSNMSGKTTFVRMLGVNAVLAQAVGTVCAREWRAPDFRIRTSIGQADSLIEGKSYYLAEVESVRRMLLARASGVPHLFLLDELFRGTNTDERIAAGYATLDHLNRGLGVTVVATHDLELHGLLGSTFVTRHFRESVDAGSLVFDYRIRMGLSSTRNAVALLEVMDFPADLVASARATLQRRADAGQTPGTAAQV